MKNFKFTGIEKMILALLIVNIFMTLVIGFTYVVFIIVVTLVVVLSWSFLRRYKNKSKLMKVAYKVVSIGTITWIISFVLIISIVLTTVTYDVSEKKYDYIVVLGAGLWGDRISPILRERLEKTLELSLLMPDTKIIVSGGKGEDELISEAEAMRKYLIEHNIDESRVILEDKSKNTSENFDFTKLVLEEISDGEESVLVITSNFHLYRALRLADKKEMDVDGVASKTPKSVYLNYLAREYLAVIKSEVFD